MAIARKTGPRHSARTIRRSALLLVLLLSWFAQPGSPDVARTRADAAPVAAVTSTTPDGPEPTSVYPQALGADRVWQAGDKGQGVTVAVIDTGISPSPDLSGRVLNVSDGLLSPSAPCKNLSGEPTCNDEY